MSKDEARVLLGYLSEIISDLRDLAQDAPLHVATNRTQHIAALQEASRALAETFGVSS
jgi:hypothetical protein